jgi:ABC-type transport system involved in multi-copper enzyme maturation permease subunit
MAPWNISPVFVYESALCARRWQTYAGRTLFLGALLVSLAVVWAIKGPRDASLNALAAVGEAFFLALSGTQLVLVLLAAPAYTAGSICLDKARGMLAHMLITDLSAAEIVVGKLASQGLGVLSLLLVGLPVLVLATLLGGIEPEAVVGGFFVNLGVALFACALALALSVWGDKPYEVLLATYLILGAWLLALPTWSWVAADLGLGPTPRWLETTNPFTLMFAPYQASGASFADYAVFLGSCVGMSSILILLAIVTLRWAALRGESRAAPKRRRRLPRVPVFTQAPDHHLILWREWRRRPATLWLRSIWGIYAILSLAATIAALGGTSMRTGEAPALVNAFQYSIGLLLVSTMAVASLFEERVNGGLDMLFVTPLSTSSIVWGKWLGNYRLALWVMLLPTVLACGAGVRDTHADAGSQFVLLLALMMSYGALVNSLGLALATWIPRFGVAVGLTVALYVLWAVGPFLLTLASGHKSGPQGFATLSPWFAVGETTFRINHGGPGELFWWKVAWLIVTAALALFLALGVEASFDRCMGRVRSKD